MDANRFEPLESAAWKGPVMSRRHVKEFRPDEALGLISADREGKVMACPSCGAQAVTRSPIRPGDGHPVEGRVTLTCGACSRVVTNIDRGSGAPERLGASSQ
jgi:hypothetical protein